MLLRHEGFRRLCHARDLLRECDDETRTVAEIARAVGLSPFHFSRQFEALFGVTPHQFRMHARLTRARELLSTGTRSVTEVCMEVGFSSLGSFSALFRRAVGETPSAYQRRFQRLEKPPGTVPPALTPGCLSLMAGLPSPSDRNETESSFREASPSAPAAESRYSTRR
jgi:AraC-like DNA-binding protein